MAGREDKDSSVRPEKWTITAGAIQGFTTLDGQISCTIKRRSGGSLSLVLGTTFGIANGASTATIIDNGYLFETTEAMTIDGPARFFLASSGSDTVVSIVRTFTAGFEIRSTTQVSFS